MDAIVNREQFELYRSRYSVWSGVYSVRCYVDSVQCTVYSVRCYVDSVQCTLYSVQCKLGSVRYQVYYVLFALYSIKCQLRNIHITELLDVLDMPLNLYQVLE